MVAGGKFNKTQSLHMYKHELDFKLNHSVYNKQEKCSDI